MGSGTRNAMHGFTLPELLTAMVVLVIVSAIALPSYRTIIRSANLTTQIHNFDATLNFARSEAVKRGRSVSVCPSTDQATCTSGTQWEQGWIVFVDKDENHTRDTGDPLEVVLRANGALVSGYTLRGTSASPCALDCYFTVNPKAQPSTAGQFVLCENGQIDPSRAVLVNTVGRITIAHDNDGVPVDMDGNDMTDCTP
jgi:type IV fimbrial biogenesis protein FimT